jgi:hypothetical protein
LASSPITTAYVLFSTEQPYLYNAFLQPCAEAEETEDPAHEALWAFVLEQVARVTGPKKAPEAAVVLWALLHGFVDIAQVQALAAGGCDFFDLRRSRDTPCFLFPIRMR